MTLCNVMSCSMADVYRCFVRWPCVMWYHTVRQMCTDVLGDDPVWCDVMQYGRYVQMFCEMTLCDVMSCSMADVYRCFVRWPCVMWCHTVWQMCTDILWDDPVRCDVMQYGRCVQMFWEMTLCDVMSCSMADVYRFCEITLCDVMSRSMADVYRCFVRWPCVMWYHTVWQTYTDVLGDDPVRCDVTQYGRCIQMFCEMNLCNVVSHGMAGVQMFCEMALCDVISHSMADVYRCFVRWPCVMLCPAIWQMCTDILWEHAAAWKWLTVQDSSLLDWFTLHLQQHFCENLTAIRLYHTHWHWDINSSRNTLSYPPH